MENLNENNLQNENVESVELESTPPLDSEMVNLENNNNLSENSGLIIDNIITIELSDYVKGFIRYFSEFKPLTQTAEGIETIENQALLVSSLYPRFLRALDNNAPLTIRAPFYMLLAHYLVISGGAISIGINAPSGLTQGASIDGVSVTMLAPPSNTELSYFFNQTRYGLAYLAWLDTQSGVMLVNN